jgi:hypothetical protein
VIIVGWEESEMGSLWICRTIWYATLRIAFGHNGITKEVYAPKQDMTERRWQSGPYLERNFDDDPEWRKVS